LSAAPAIGEQNVALPGGATLRFEPFDTKHLGGRAYSIVYPASISDPDLKSALEKVRQFVAGQKDIVLVTGRAQTPTQQEAHRQAGFHQVETFLTFSKSLGADLEAKPDARVGPAVPDDEAACVALGGSAFVYDRFHRDPAVPNSAADALKAEWVMNGLRGRADRTFVARAGGQVVGFNLCMLRNDVPWIDLIAVDSRHRRKGLARALVDASLLHYRDRGFARLDVKTQSENPDSVLLYKRCGFELTDTAAAFHLTPGVS
jgi:ribosomal protein S18 acetylase RimI-like enzyme